MRLKSMAGLFAALLFAFAVAACNDANDDATDAPAASPVVTEVPA